MKIEFEAFELLRGAFGLRLDFTFQEDVLLIQGASGSGKSLLLRSLAGLERPAAGCLRVDGRLWSDPRRVLPPEHRPLSMVFQDYRLFPHLDVLANLRFAGASRQAAGELAERFRIQDLLARRIDRLSGGERQRVAVLRALLRPCRLLLLDEPLSALDPAHRDFWLQELDAFRREQQVQLFYVSHNEDEMACWPGAPCFEPGRGLIRTA